MNGGSNVIWDSNLVCSIGTLVEYFASCHFHQRGSSVESLHVVGWQATQKLNFNNSIKPGIRRHWVLAWELDICTLETERRKRRKYIWMRDSIYLIELLNFLNRPLFGYWPTD